MGTEPREKCGALPGLRAYLWLIQFQAPVRVKKRRELFSDHLKASGMRGLVACLASQAG